MSTKKVLISALFATAHIIAFAQSSTNSPYTRFGFGDLYDQVFTNNAAMGGVGNALRSSRHINTMNPASYTSVDSLSFMFDIGFSMKSSNYKEGNIKSNARNSSFDYLAMQFRLHPRIGMVIGFTPFSTVGYNFSTSDYASNSNSVSVTNTYFGDGGTNVVFAGLGFKILDNLSIGGNIGYLYGKHEYTTTATLSNGGDYTINFRNLKVKSYKLDLGLQYTQPVNKDNYITLGLTYGLGHNLKSTESIGTQVTDGNTYTSTTSNTFYDGYGIPSTYGVGLSYQHKDRLTVCLDYTMQEWSKVNLSNKAGMYNNRSKIAAGIEYTPNQIGRNFLQRISYRAGVYYTTPYIKIPDNSEATSYSDGAREIGVGAGFGFPLSLFQRKTMLSITGQYINLSPSNTNLMSENRFVLKIGLTLNEPWFMKWRVN
ncbi:hypothetical protein I6E11_04440 [Bacteroides caecigallinarum]|uniref:hypothetical protein n=1 Tax=Bacteroides caecigallinarum TaxID=1411144 RepID=UPI001F286561|nr:hypothetical protein [Bacteroides caecigallinarum]MCF2593057.1 hypothetical protein [Bacteroides caecigallinarum]